MVARKQSLNPDGKGKSSTARNSSAPSPKLNQFGKPKRGLSGSELQRRDDQINKVWDMYDAQKKRDGATPGVILKVKNPEYDSKGAYKPGTGTYLGFYDYKTGTKMDPKSLLPKRGKRSGRR
jgi:hypothetical protein